MRPKGTSAELERRRRRAVELVEGGEPPSVVARILDVHATSIHSWRRLARSGQGLQAKPLTGRAPLLSDDQLVQLEALLLKGAKAHGWTNELWTADRAAGLIKKHFGVDHSPEHVLKLR